MIFGLFHIVLSQFNYLNMSVMKRVFVLIFVPLFFASCEKSGYSLGDIWVSIATVENPDNSSAFFFRLDNDERMWTAATSLPHYRPKDGQRILAYYTILSDKPESSSYDHDVKLNSVYRILTKDIFKITPETQDSIGNDPIKIVDIWIGSDYLNVEFEFAGQYKTHFISLVSDESKTYDDGKVHLEFRHNANNDALSYRNWGLASFNIMPLQPSGTDRITLVIHTNEYDEPEEKLYELTYIFDGSADRVRSLSPEGAIGEVE